MAESTMHHGALRAAVVVSLLMPTSLLAQDVWARADSAVRRLDPGAIPRLPDAVTAALKNRDCTIPQSFITTEPHNVVAGDLRGNGRTAWAALCSRASVTTILVFADADTTRIDSLEVAPDGHYLQNMGDQGIVFSRQLSVVDSAFIWRQAHAFGDAPPPSPTHAALQDAFLGKGSVIWYWDRRRWLKLTGVD